MIQLLFIACMILSLLLVILERSDWTTVYEGAESSICEAQLIYWMLKNNKVTCSYRVPFNWNNFAQFKYEENKVLLKVPKSQAQKANQLIKLYRSSIALQ